MSLRANRRVRILVWSVALALLASAALAQAAYEPFSYPANAAINGQNGGTGWGAPWVGNSALVSAPGLAYPGLATAGNALGRTPGSASTRNLASPVVGAAGSTLVLSALFRSNVAGTPATQATLGNSSGGTFIIGDLPQSDPQAGNWGLQNAAGRFYSTVPVAANSTVYLVAEIDFNVSGSNDRMRLWVNPPANAYFTVAPAVDVTNADVAQFSGVFWQTQQNQVVDEIHVATSRNACLQPPNTTMVAWYPFDETSGGVAGNLATSNAGLELNGPVPAPGVVAGALAFDGIDDYVDSPSSIITNFGPGTNTATCGGKFSSCPGDFSIDAWVKLPTGGATGTPTIVDKRVGNPPAIRGYSFFIYQGTIGIQLADGLNSGFGNFLSPLVTPALDDGNWHHLTVTVKRTQAAGIRFYHNGNPIGTANPTSRLGSLVNNAPLRIGARTAAPPLSGYFRGNLDELEIFNRVLTPVEVKALFLAGPFGKCK